METIRTRRGLAAIVTLLLTMTLAFMTLAGCSSSSSKPSGSTAMRSITDMRGRTVEIPESVDKVVGIGCALRPICYLGAVDKVVGVEEAEHEDSVSCAYRHVNNKTFSKLPVIGEGGSKGVTANEEAIVKAAPQVIICDSLQADEADALQQKTGIPVVCLDQPETVFDQQYYDNLIFLGEVLGKQDRATAVIDYIKNAEADLNQRASSSNENGKVTAYAAGISYRGGHGFDGTEANFPPFTCCNVTNIADGHGSDGPFTIDLEAVSSAQPGYIFIESGNLNMVADDYKANPAYFDSLSAVKDGKTYTLISYRFYSTNVELAIANCYQVGATVYPDTFGDVDPTKKLDEISEFFLGAPLSKDLAQQGGVFEQVDITKL